MPLCQIVFDSIQRSHIIVTNEFDLVIFLNRAMGEKYGTKVLGNWGKHETDDLFYGGSCQL